MSEQVNETEALKFERLARSASSQPVKLGLRQELIMSPQEGEGFTQLAKRLYRSAGYSEVQAKKAFFMLTAQFIREMEETNPKLKPGDVLRVGPKAATLVRIEDGRPQEYTVHFTAEQALEERRETGAKTVQSATRHNIDHLKQEVNHFKVLEKILGLESNFALVTTNPEFAKDFFRGQNMPKGYGTYVFSQLVYQRNANVRGAATFDFYVGVEPSTGKAVVFKADRYAPELLWRGRSIDLRKGIAEAKKHEANE